MRWMWIDRIVEFTPRERLVAVKNVSLAEEYLHDHFPAAPGRPAMPIMPASLIIEGAAQSAGILVGHAGGFQEKVILAKIGSAVIERDAVPGTTLRYTAMIVQMLANGAMTTCDVELMDHARPEAGYEPIGRVEMIFSHIDKSMAGTAFPEHNFVFGESFKTLLRISGIDTPGST